MSTFLMSTILMSSNRGTLVKQTLVKQTLVKPHAQHAREDAPRPRHPLSNSAGSQVTSLRMDDFTLVKYGRSMFAGETCP